MLAFTVTEIEFGSGFIWILMFAFSYIRERNVHKLPTHHGNTFLQIEDGCNSVSISIIMKIHFHTY